MLFNSFDYIFFLAIVFLAFWGLEPHTNPALRSTDQRTAQNLQNARTTLLLIASYLFYASWNAVFLVLIVLSTWVDYAVGRRLYTENRPGIRRSLLAISLFTNLGLLGLFKYGDFAITVSGQLANQLGYSWQPSPLNLILPVGISFYTFQTLSYTIDLYRKKIDPARNLLEFATYVAFFPQLVAGPIVRASEFLPQFLQTPTLTKAQAQRGLYLILRGLVKKIAIADFLGANFVDRVFADPTAFSSSEAWVAIFAYTWQLYADFSGYTDIARGSARLLGFELPINFRRPLNVTGPIEFWRHWHITLSRWVQDYIYIPLGGSRRGRVRTYTNLFMSFMIIGVWHGSGWNFVLFGLWHATGVTLNRAFRDLRNASQVQASPSTRIRPLWVVAHFVYFAFHWPIFRGQSVDASLAYYQVLLAGDWDGLRVNISIWFIITLMGILHFCPKRWIDRMEALVCNLSWPWMAGLLVATGYALMHLAAQQPTPFVYFQF